MRGMIVSKCSISGFQLRRVCSLQVMFTGDHLAFRAVRPTEAKPFMSEDDKLSVFECAPPKQCLWWVVSLCLVAWNHEPPVHFSLLHENHHACQLLLC